MVQIEIDASDFEEIMREDLDVKFSLALEREMAQVLPQISEIIRGWLEDYTPRQTGETATSWRVIAFGPNDYEIANSNEPIITFLTEGTRTHFVAPVNAEALHWTSEDGFDRFSKGHWVSGIAPTDIIGMALISTEPEVDALFDAAIDAAWTDAMG